jgi:AhpD family alkylhydroperoxidase
LELVKLRASQINGCGHCIDMHVKELRAMGEGEQRLHLLDAQLGGVAVLQRSRARSANLV